jgi:tetratricopeptide (TPR) repeat protein
MRAVFYLVVALAVNSCVAQPIELALDQSVRVPAGARNRSFRLSAKADECVHLRIDQGPNDLAVVVENSDEAQLTFDSFETGEEPVGFCAAIDSEYELSVRVVSGETTPEFSISFTEIAARSPSAMMRNEAIRLSSKTKRLKREQKLNEALTTVSAAVDLWSEVEDPMISAAQAAKGGILYRLDRKAEALENYTTAIKGARESGNSRLLAEALNNSALCIHETSGDPRSALANLAEAIDLWQRMGDSHDVAAANVNRALIWSQSGEFRRAAEAYLEAEAAFDSTGDLRSQATALANLAVAYARLGENESARAQIEKAVALLRKTNFSVDMARALTIASFIHRNLNDSAHLNQAADEATEAIRLLASQPISLVRADALDNLGLVFAERRDFANALPVYQLAVDLYGTADLRGRANALAHLGSAKGELNQLDSAVESLDAAEALYRGIEMPDAVAATLWRKAHVHVLANQLLRARAELREAVQLVEDLRTRIAGDVFRTHFLAEKRRYFIDYVEVLMQLHKEQPAAGFDREAFDAAELARARGLLDLVSLPRDIATTLPDDLRLELDSIQQVLDYRAARANRILNSAQPLPAKVTEEIQRDLKAALDAYHEVEARIEERNSAFAALSRPQPVPIGQIQRELDRTSVIIAIWLAPAHSYAWAVTHDRLMSYELPPSDEVERYTALATPSAPIASTRADEARAWISRVIVEPALRLAQPKRIAFIVNGPLQTLPFAGVPDPLSRSGIPLGLTREIVYVPSVAVIQQLRARAHNLAPSKSVILYVDPVFSSGDSRRMGSRGYRAAEPELGRLLLTRRLPSEFEKHLSKSEISSNRDFAASRQRMLGKDGMNIHDLK